MRVLQIINSLNTGGAEKLLLDSLPLYEKKNIRVDILILQKTETPFLEQLQTNFKGRIFFSTVKSLYNPRQIRIVRKYIKNYDIVHVHLFPSLYWVALAKNSSKRFPILIFTEHNTENRRINNPTLRFFDKLIYRSYKIITAISLEVKIALIYKLKIKSDKIKVIYNGINVESFSYSERYPTTDFFSRENIKLMIQVSRFSKQKDQKTAIRALKLLPINYCMLFVGDGETRFACTELVKELELESRVLFLGNRMDVPKLLKTSDIVIQSSNWEGFGLAAVEGMAAGKPVIASNVPGLSNIVSGAGLLFERGNEYELAEKILSLESSELYYDTKQKCVERSISYNINYMVDHTINLYNSLLQ